MRLRPTRKTILLITCGILVDYLHLGLHYLMDLKYSIFWSATIISNIHLVTAKDYEWRVKSESPCSSSCDGGLKTVTYQCVEYDNYTRMFNYIDDANCIHVKKPPPKRQCNLKPCDPSQWKRSTKEERRYEWRDSDRWTSCKNSRGKLSQKCSRIQECIDKSLNESVNQSYCKHLKKNDSDCYKCPYWKPGAWSNCTATCGRGTASREVYCYILDKGVWEIDAVKHIACRQQPKPQARKYCAEINCPVKYITTQWSNCEYTRVDSSYRGKSCRKVFCTQKNKFGKITKKPIRKCYKKYGKIPVEFKWMSCRNNSEKCKAAMRKISIVTSDATVIQIQPKKKLRAQVGEKVTAFIGTTLILRCPVISFKERDVLWEHDRKIFGLTKGHKKGRRRIRVDFRGRLKVRLLTRKDRGHWRCIAGNRIASVKVEIRDAREGFQKLSAQSQISTKQRNVDGFIYNEVPLQWVVFEWSSCSVTCGKPGVMRRKVGCGRPHDRYYKIYDDSFCVKVKNHKPNTTKICGIPTTECPEWIINPNLTICTDECIGVGHALLKVKFSCKLRNVNLPKSSCDQSKKPREYTSCNNADCFPRWKASHWSQCSRSCGESGVSTRRFRCVWKKSEKKAGVNCDLINLKRPTTVAYCQLPKCA